VHKNEYHAVESCYELLIAIRRRFVQGFEKSHIEDKEALTVLWAGTPFPFWNDIFLSKSVDSAEQLRVAMNEAVAIAASKKQPGLICVCSSLLNETAYEQADSILSKAGYPNSAPITRMTAEGFFPIANLRIERLRDFRIPIELNCGAHGVPLEAAKPSTLSEHSAQEAFIYVDYGADRPVCAATILVQEFVVSRSGCNS
jgi:hypothetical protein